MGDARVCARESKLYTRVSYLVLLKVSTWLKSPFLLLFYVKVFGTWTHKMGIRILFFHTRFSYNFFFLLLFRSIRLYPSHTCVECCCCCILNLWMFILYMVVRWLLSWFKYVSTYIMKRCFQIALPSVFMNVIEILVIYIFIP